ncbi:PAS domain-containing protein [Marinoscillum furvescens]|uniref:PAS domain S-box-containing protein n=1 Tax=Marinoscillum furvescens DSM 4134 TaxID=1122208 RepID=A0A3D9L209_MARFU|nr:PAS domain S-box protein [Marinoscillum furvescens]RED97426.1 PAS domain S-box-containing protein [Marinoscillum furvescens DSM 4134]
MKIDNKSLSGKLSEELIKEVSRRKYAEKLLSLFVKHAPGAIAMFDRDMVCLAASDRWYTAFDLQRVDIAGKHFYDILPEAREKKDWAAYHQRVLNGEKLHQKEDQLRLSDGETAKLSWEMIPWHNRDGHIGGVIISIEILKPDIDLQKDLNRNKELLQMALDVSNVGVWHWTEEDNKLTWNDRMYAIFNCEGNSIYNGDQFFDLLEERDRKRMATLLQRTVQQGGDYTTEYQIKGNRFVKEYGKVFDEGGRLRMTGICMDVTQDRASMKHKVDQQYAYRYAVDHSPTATAIFDNKGKCVQINAALSELLGFEESDWVGVDYKSIMHPEDEDFYLSEVNKLISGERKFIDKRKKCITRGGYEIATKLTIALVRDASNKPHHFVVSLIPESKQIRESNRVSLPPQKRSFDIHRIISEFPKEYHHKINLQKTPMVLGDQQTLEKVFYALIDALIRHLPHSNTIEVLGDTNISHDIIFITAISDKTGVSDHRSEKSFIELPPDLKIVVDLCERLLSGQGGSLYAESPNSGGLTFTVLLPRY